MTDAECATEFQLSSLCPSGPCLYVPEGTLTFEPCTETYEATSRCPDGCDKTETPESTEYASIYNVAAFGTVLYVLGCVAFYRGLIDNRKGFEELQDQMKPKFAKFQLWMLAKKLIITFVANFTPDVTRGWFLTNMVVAAALVLQIWFSPYASTAANACETLGLVVTLIVVTCGATFRQEASSLGSAQALAEGNLDGALDGTTTHADRDMEAMEKDLQSAQTPGFSFSYDEKHGFVHTKFLGEHWYLVRYTSGTPSGCWHESMDNLEGTSEYGLNEDGSYPFTHPKSGPSIELSALELPNAFSVPFYHFEYWEMMVTSADSSMWAVLPRTTVDKCALDDLTPDQIESWDFPTQEEGDSRSQDGPRFVQSSAFLLNNISLAIGCESNTDAYVEDPLVTLHGDARPFRDTSGVIYAEGGTEFCRGGNFNFESSALGHGGSLVWVNSVQSTVGSFTNILAYIVGSLILSQLALNFLVQMVPFLSHDRPHANTTLYSIFVGILAMLVYAVLAGERQVTMESAIAILPVFFVIFGAVWYKEVLDMLIRKVCDHNDGNRDKIAVEVEIRFDMPGLAFEEWLDVKHNRVQNLEKRWNAFSKSGCDRLDLARDMTVEELKTNMPDLDHAEATKLHGIFDKLNRKIDFRAASQLKRKYNEKLSNIGSVFTQYSSKLYQGKTTDLMRLMVQYAVAVQYYKNLKVHLKAFAAENGLCATTDKWFANRAIKRFGRAAKRTLQAWFRVMKDYPGQLVNLREVWTRALDDLWTKSFEQSIMSGMLTGKSTSQSQRKAQLEWVEQYHTKLLIEMLKKHLAADRPPEIRNIEKHEDEARAFMRVEFSTTWPRPAQHKDGPPGFDDDGNIDDVVPELRYELMDEEHLKPVVSEKVTVEKFQQLLADTKTPVNLDTKVLSDHSDFKAVFDQSWTAWRDCQLLFASFLPSAADNDNRVSEDQGGTHIAFENPLSLLDSESGKQDATADAPRTKKLNAPVVIESAELLDCSTFRQLLLRDNHVTGRQPFLIDSGYDNETNLECRLVGVQAYGTLEVVSKFASDAVADYNFEASTTGAFIQALRRLDIVEMGQLSQRAASGAISHIWAWCMSPFHQVHRQELRLFYRTFASILTEDDATIVGPVTISHMRLMYLVGMITDSTFIWTSKDWGWSDIDESTGETRTWDRWIQIQDSPEITELLRRKSKIAVVDQTIKQTPETGTGTSCGPVCSHHIGKLKQHTRVYVVNTVTDDSGAVSLEIELKRGKTGWVQETTTDSEGNAQPLLRTEDPATQRAAVLKEINDARRAELESMTMGELFKMAEESGEFNDEESREKLYNLGKHNPKEQLIEILLHLQHDHREWLGEVASDVTSVAHAQTPWGVAFNEATAEQLADALLVATQRQKLIEACLQHTQKIMMGALHAAPMAERKQVHRQVTKQLDTLAAQPLCTSSVWNTDEGRAAASTISEMMRRLFGTAIETNEHLDVQRGARFVEIVRLGPETGRHLNHTDESKEADPDSEAERSSASHNVE